MATIIQTGPNSFIAGDPPEQLDIGQHWCPSCGGTGLEYDWDDALTICFGCGGVCVLDCNDTACPTHSTLHPARVYQHATPADSAGVKSTPLLGL